MQEDQATENQDCLNCKAPLSPKDDFCFACGQKRTTGRITFKQLIADFFDNVFNLDSRVFLTLRNLLIPGWLTVEYFRGRHKMYLHPFRLFLVALIAMVATISWKVNELIVSDGDIMERMARARIEREMILELDSLNHLYEAKEGKQGLNTALDTLKKKTYARHRLKNDSIDLDQYFSLFAEDFAPMHIDDVFTLDSEELAVKYKIEGVKRKWLLQQKLKVIKDSRSFLRFLIGRISWMCLLLIPFLAIGLVPLYWRKGFYYVEHFIFSVHTHTVFFILCSLQIVALSFLPAWTIAVSTIGFGVYLAIAMHRFYQQGWWRTLMKFCLITLFIYWGFIMLSAVIAIILGVLLF